MVCEKPEIATLLSDYYTGHLDDDSRKSMEDHLNSCRDCRVTLRTIALIASRPSDTGTTDDRHFSPQLLARYYMEPGSLDPTLIAQIKDHVAVCPECGEDLQFLQNSNLEFSALVSSAVGPERVKSGSIWQRVVKTLSSFRRG